MKYQAFITKTFTWIKEIEANNIDDLKQKAFTLDLDPCEAECFTNYDFDNLGE